MLCGSQNGLSVMRVEGLQGFGVSFDYQIARRRLVEVQRVHFDCPNACKTLVEVQRVRLTTTKHVGDPEEDQRVCFDV